MNRTVPKDSRLEIKFVANESEKDRLTHWVRLHPAGLTSPFPPRWINNLYLDTYDYFAFGQNLSGASGRSKLRYRWYGYDIHPSKGALELKCKRNYFGWKLRFPIKTPPYASGDHWREFMAKLNPQLPAQAQMYLAANPQPIILTRYLRHYYVTNDRKVRVTMDTQQSVFDQRYKPYPNTTHQANTPKTMVLEVKFNRHDRDYAASLIQGLPIRVSRNSKYVIGLRTVHGF